MHTKMDEKRVCHMSFLTPDELYGQYISTAKGFPKDASTWSLTLCSRLFNYLTLSLQDKMEEDSFQIKPLNSQSTKTLHLGLIIIQLDSYL